MLLIAPVIAHLILLAEGPAHSADVSAATEECLGCHEEVPPGIVGDGKASRHAKVTPAEALRKPALERRISAGGARRAALTAAAVFAAVEIDKRFARLVRPAARRGNGAA